MTDEQFKELTEKLDKVIDTKLSEIRGDTDTAIKELIKIRYVLEDQKRQLDKLIEKIDNLTNV